ncbi:MAG: Crp/Fnr family transcriptional regulator [Bacteroidota bacterium]
MNRNRFVVNYKPGELIYKQGSSFTHVISLSTGKVKMYIEGSRDIIIKIAKPVELIIGPGIYIDQKHYNSASALEEVNACFIEVGDFKEVFRRNPRFAEEVTREISSKGLSTLQKMMSLNLKQTPGLVAEALIHLADDVFGTMRYKMILSRQELADLCGVTKESVIRVLKDFKHEGIIKSEGHYIEILDYNMIKKISQLG